MEDVKIDLNGTLGAAFMGHFATAVLYGITSLQSFVYYKQRRRDTPILRWLVLVLWILDGVHVALITYSMYFYMVLNFANPLIIEKPIWSIMSMIIVSNVSNIIVRGVFGYRIWKMTGRGITLPLLIGILSLYIAGDGFYFAAEGMRISSYLEIAHFSWSLYVGFAFEVFVDGIITISQCMVLRKFRTGIRSTDSVVSVLMLYSINTGLFTSICAFICLLTYTLLPDMFVYFIFYFMLSKLYVNALLANLNARSSIMDSISSPAGIRPFQTYQGSDTTTTPSMNQVRPTAAQFTSVIDPLILSSAFPRDSVVVAECEP